MLVTRPCEEPPHAPWLWMCNYNWRKNAWSPRTAEGTDMLPAGISYHVLQMGIFWAEFLSYPHALHLQRFPDLQHSPPQNKLFPLKKLPQLIKQSLGTFFSVSWREIPATKLWWHPGFGLENCWGYEGKECIIPSFPVRLTLVCRGNALHQFLCDIFLEESVVYWVLWNKTKWASCLHFFLSFVGLLLPSATWLCFHLFSFKQSLMNPFSPHKSSTDSFFPTSLAVISLRDVGGKEAVVWSGDLCN